MVVPPTLDLSPDEIDWLYTSEKIAVSDGAWENRAGSIRWYLTLDVSTLDGKEMEVRGAYSSRGEREYSFALLYRNVPLRRWDIQTGHDDPLSNEESNGPHKHYYTTAYGDACFYHVSDIRLNDVNDGLIDFLNECNVHLGSAIIQNMIGV